MTSLGSLLMVGLELVVEQTFQLMRIQIAADDQTQASVMNSTMWWSARMRG